MAAVIEQRLSKPEQIETQQTISAWADETFGEAGSNVRVAVRANEEMAELLRALTVDENHPKAMEEIADVYIVLCRVAARRRHPGGSGPEDGGQSDPRVAEGRDRSRLSRPQAGMHRGDPRGCDGGTMNTPALKRVGETRA